MSTNMITEELLHTTCDSFLNGIDLENASMKSAFVFVQEELKLSTEELHKYKDTIRTYVKTQVQARIAAAQQTVEEIPQIDALEEEPKSKHKKKKTHSRQRSESPSPPVVAARKQKRSKKTKTKQELLFENLKKLARIVGRISLSGVNQMDMHEAIKRLKGALDERDIAYDKQALSKDGLKQAQARRELEDLHPPMMKKKKRQVDAEEDEEEEETVTTEVVLPKRTSIKPIVVDDTSPDDIADTSSPSETESSNESEDDYIPETTEVLATDE